MSSGKSKQTVKFQCGKDNLPVSSSRETKPMPMSQEKLPVKRDFSMRSSSIVVSDEEDCTAECRDEKCVACAVRPAKRARMLAGIYINNRPVEEDDVEAASHPLVPHTTKHEVRLPASSKPLQYVKNRPPLRAPPRLIAVRMPSPATTIIMTTEERHDFVMKKLQDAKLARLRAYLQKRGKLAVPACEQIPKIHLKKTKACRTKDEMDAASILSFCLPQSTDVRKTFVSPQDSSPNHRPLARPVGVLRMTL
jgi:hypothetical protein